MSAQDSDSGLEMSVDQSEPMPLHGALRCAAGELTALVGPSGAGKSSMLRVMAGLMRPQQGHVRIGEEVWLDAARGIFLPPQLRHVGLVFQHYALMPHLSALDNVGLPLFGLPKADRRREAARWLERVHLSGDLINRRPAALSGGERQRVAVARALARQPRLILLDEPFSAVDQMTRRGLYAVIADLRSDLSIPIVLVTHDLAEASLLADRLVVMDAGEVLQEGTPHFLHRSPRNSRVADLVGIQNRFRGIWEGPSDRQGYGRLKWLVPTDGDQTGGPVLEVVDKRRLKPGQEVSWVIPGEGLELVDSASSKPGQYAARISDLRHLGETTLVNLRLDLWPGAEISMTLSGPRQRGLIQGAALIVEIDTDRVHVMPRLTRPARDGVPTPSIAVDPAPGNADRPFL